MSSANGHRSERGLSLGDYLAHQRALRSLQRSQPVWIVDTLLGLRYRARLQLRLRPSKYLLLTDDAAHGEGSSSSNNNADATNALTSSSSSLGSAVVIPLVPTCTIDCCGVDGSAGFDALRLSLPEALFSSVDDSNAAGSGNAVDVDEAEGIVHVLVPMETQLDADASAAVVQAWAAVLSSLCHPVRTVAATSSAAPPATANTTNGTRGASSSLPMHRDPTGAISPLAAMHPTPVLSRATTTATTKPAASATKVAATSKSVAAAAAHTAQRSPPRHVDAPARNSSPMAVPPQPSTRSHDEPPPVHFALSAPAAAVVKEDAATQKGVVEEEEDEEEERVDRMRDVLRHRTGAIAHLTTYLRTSLSPMRESLSNGADSAVEVAVPEEDHDSNAERPATMAHISSGLVPALRGFSSLSALASSSSDDDVEGQEGREGASGTHGSAYPNPSDSPRPQAPRGGHVCNLGSIGPSSGDEEALRMYKDIHGSYSSTASSLVHGPAAAAADGDAAAQGGGDSASASSLSSTAHGAPAAESSEQREAH